MSHKLVTISRILIPTYLSLVGVLNGFQIPESNADYVELHPIRTALYKKLFHSPTIIISILVLWALIEAVSWAKTKLGNPKQKELIKFILNQYRGKAFNTQPDDPEDHHRVTLFKYKKRHFQLKISYWTDNKTLRGKLARFWPRPCLVYFLRSGKLSQNTNVVFPVYDDSDKTNGWAAHVWSTGCAEVVGHLPEVLNGEGNRNVEREYAAKTRSTVEVVRNYRAAGRPMPRAIAAIPIEVHGSPWGVLVLDSRRPDGVPENSIDNFRITVATIQKILEMKL